MDPQTLLADRALKTGQQLAGTGGGGQRQCGGEVGRHLVDCRVEEGSRCGVLAADETSGK